MHYPPNPERIARRMLFTVIVIYLGLGITYSITNPIFEAPDEVWHYAYIRELAIYHRLPIVDTAGQQPYRHEGLQPPLYYSLGSMLISRITTSDLMTLPKQNPYARIGDPRAETNDNRNAFLHSPDEHFPFQGMAFAVHALRLYSIILGAITIVLTYALAKSVFPEHVTIALSAAAFVALLPQFIFISSAISNDNLATLLAVSTLYQLARTMRLGLNHTRVILLGVTVGAALLTKLTTIALVPLVLLTLWYIAFKDHNWRIAIADAAILLGMVLLVAGWWYIRNLMIYGDLTAFGRLAILVGQRSGAMSFWRWVGAESEGLRLSSWGLFGWFNIRASSLFYNFYDGLALTGFIGIVVALVTRRILKIDLAILALWCGLIFVALWVYASTIITSQGRLLFPALPAWAILWSWGIAALAPMRFRLWVTLGLSCVQTIIAALVPLIRFR